MSTIADWMAWRFMFFDGARVMPWPRGAGLAANPGWVDTKCEGDCALSAKATARSAQVRAHLLKIEVGVEVACEVPFAPEPLPTLDPQVSEDPMVVRLDLGPAWYQAPHIKAPRRASL